MLSYGLVEQGRIERSFDMCLKNIKQNTHFNVELFLMIFDIVLRNNLVKNDLFVDSALPTSPVSVTFVLWSLDSVFVLW